MQTKNADLGRYSTLILSKSNERIPKKKQRTFRPDHKLNYVKFNTYKPVVEGVFAS